MRCPIDRLAIIAVCAFAPWSSGFAQERATDAPIAAPYLNGAQIRALRPSGPAQVVRFEVSVNRQVGNEAAVSEQQRVTLGPDYFAVEMGGELRVYDFALDRFFYVGPGDDYLQSTSLYGDVAFRHHETVNREFMRRALAGVASPVLVDQYYVESELGIETPDAPPVTLSLERQDGAATAKRDQEVLAEISFSPRAPVGAARDMFRRYLAYELPLHPRILALIEDTPTEPQSMVVAHGVAGSLARPTFTLGGWEVSEDDYPIGATLRPQAPSDQTDEQRRRYLAAALPLVTGAVAPPTLAELVEEAGHAADEGDTVGAITTVFIALQRSLEEIERCVVAGDPACTAVSTLVNRAYKDPSAARVLLAFQVDQSDGRAVAEAVAALAAIDFDRHRNGPTLNVALASHIIIARRHQTFDPSVLQGKPSDPVELILRGIEHAPHVANYQKELAEAFHRAFEMSAAWTVFDLARSLPAGSPATCFRR